MHYLYIGRNIVIIFVELVEVAVTAGVGPPVMLIGEGVLISSQDGFTAVLPGWSELCSSNHVEAGSLPGPISNQFYFVFVVIVPSFYILIYVKEGVFGLFSGVFLIFVVDFLKSFCNILTLGDELASELLGVFF